MSNASLAAVSSVRHRAVGRMIASAGLAALALQTMGCEGCGDGELTAPELPVVSTERPAFPSPAEGSAAPAAPAEVAVEEQQLAIAEGDTNLPAPPEGAAPTLPLDAAALAISPVTGNWTTVRGDAAHSGHRQAPAIQTPRVAWSVQVGIQGYANTPIVTPDAIYVSSQGERHNNTNPERDTADGVLRINPVTGAVVWRLRLERDQNGMMLAGTTLLVGSDSGVLTAIDTVAGTVRWSVNVGCPIYQAPVVVDDQILLPRVGGISRLRLADGQPVNGTLLPCDVHRRETFSVDAAGIFLSANDRPLEAYSTTGGVWRAPEPVASRRASLAAWQPPLLTQGYVLQGYEQWPFTNPDGSVARRAAVVAHDRTTAQPAWVIDVNNPRQAQDDRDFPTAFWHMTPYLDGTRLVVASTNRNELAIYDATTGQAAGSVRLPDCRRRQFASPVGVPGMLYYARHDGMLYGVSLDGQPGIRWSVSLGLHGAAGGRETHEPIAGGCSQNPVNGTALFSTPAIAEDGTVYIGAGDGWLYAIRDASWPALEAAVEAPAQ